jgi:hypothetical protein
MTERVEVTRLEREWKHASRIAFESIGQPDRAANVAYRDQVAEKLKAARAAAGSYQGTDKP